jgi:MFS family permease
MYYGNYLAALSFFLGFVSGAVHLHSRGVFLRDQLIDFEASRAGISLVFSAATAAGALFAPVLGYLLDHNPVRRVMLVGAAWMGIGFFVLSQASTLVQFGVLTTLVVGLGTGAIGTTANSKLMVEWFDRRRGLALAVAITGYAVAGIVMAPAALTMLETFGWRGSYIVFGAVLLFMVLPLVGLLVRGNPPRLSTAAARSEDRTFKGQLSVYLDFARTPAFWVCTLTFGLMAAVLGGLSLHLFLHFTDRGISELQAASILSIEGAFALASKPLVGWMIDRFGARDATLVAVFGCVLSLVALLAAQSYAASVVAGALIGLSFGAVIPLQAAMLSTLFGADRFARAYGSLRLATFPLIVGSPLLIGLSHDLTGSYSAAFVLFAILFLLALAAAWVMRATSAIGSVAPR